MRVKPYSAPVGCPSRVVSGGLEKKRDTAASSRQQEEVS
jgi:hypothetical protein